jgi:putative protease
MLRFETVTAPLLKPELLAPAGNWDCARAAVANGADAIYFGLPAFNARMRADNFTFDDLPELMKFLHQHGVKGFVAMNVLIFTDELAEAERYLHQMVRAGVDAIIVQDLGLCVLAQASAPTLELHASTQMTITSPEGLQFAQKLGLSRAVLARETSLRELAKFQDENQLPLETFVHGALCVAYSGQCLTSESLGQRSANRGECAQACRMPYELVVDGLTRDLGDKKYLLSPQDLAALEEIPRLMELGVASFKIEGRLKTPEYVAAITSIYRKKIDETVAAVSDRRTSGGQRPPLQGVTPQEKYVMEMAFSRGLYSGWMHGVNHQELVHARFGKKRGAYLGTVEKVGPHHFEMTPLHPLQVGDGIVFENLEDTDREQGGRIFRHQGVRYYLYGHKTDFSQIKAGARVWKTDDPQLNRALRKTLRGEPPRRTTPLHFSVSGKVGSPLTLSTLGRSVQSNVTLQAAERQPLTTAILREQLGRLGDTPFSLGEVTNALEGQVILPLKELNRLRRDLTNRLLPKTSTTAAPQIYQRLSSLLPDATSCSSLITNHSSLTVLCRSLPQVQTALDLGVSTLYVDFEDIRRYAEAVALARTHGSSQILLATPRIQKAGEEGFFRLIENAKPDGVLIRNLGALAFFRDSALCRIGDFSLNVSNPLTAQLLKKEGLERLTISYDLNVDQVLALLKAAPPHWFEITLHQHMPMFHMEHCVFAAFLSQGTDHTNCGRPCDRHEVKLRDRVGQEHPLKADVGCRNTVFNSQAQSGAYFLEQFQTQGARCFRVELLNESAEETQRILQNYQSLLSGATTSDALVKDLHVRNQLGVTLGTLKVNA